LSHSTTWAGDLTLLNARVIDGNEHEPFVASIVIRDGEIVDISPVIKNPTGEVIDLTGFTILPGLIDSHVHLQSVPGSKYRNDSIEVIEELRKHHLKAYVASGVTTVLDTGISAPVLRDIQNHLKRGGTGPRVLALAPVLFSAGGYLDDEVFKTSSKPTRNEADVLDLFEEFKDIPGIVGIKVPLEYGFLPSQKWPIHSPEMRKTIMRIATEKDRPLYIHGMSEEEQTLAIKMGARALVHSGFWDESPSEEFLHLIADRQTFLISTLSGTLDLQLDRWHPERLDYPLITLTVPALELATLKDPKAWEWSSHEFGRNILPGWMPDFVVDVLSSFFANEEAIVMMLDSATSAVKTMYDRGVPIVAGTDSGNNPIMLNFFHGPSMIRELELLSIAGLPNAAVIKSATATPAEMLGIDKTVGTIEVGKRADLIITSCDPLDDISCLRQLEWIVKDGVMKMPVQWMDSDDSSLRPASEENNDR